MRDQDETSGSERVAQVLRLVPHTEVEPQLAEAEEALTSGNPEVAWGLLNTPTIAASSARASHLRGRALHALGRTEEAVVEMDRAVNHSGEQADLLIHRSEILAELGRWDQAVRDTRRALDIEDTAAHWLAHANALAGIGADEEAIEALSTAFEADHRAVAVVSRRGDLYMAQACYVAALADFATCCVLQPTDAQHWVHRGNAWYELGEFAAATLDYEQALELDPNLSEVSLNLGCIALDEDNITTAVRCFGRAIALQPDMGRAYLNRGIAYFYAAEDEKAEADFRQTIELEPDDGDAYYALARLLARQARYRDAVECLDGALERCPEYVDELVTDSLFDDVRKLKQVKWLIARAADALG